MIVNMSNDSMKQAMVQQLLDKGVTESKDGTSVHDLDFYELRHELVMFDIRNGTDVDVNSSANEWF